MAKKFDFDWKTFMLQKGEKVGLGVGVGILALMLIFGVKGVFSSSPSANAKTLNDKTDAARRLIASNTPRDKSIFEVDQSMLVASALPPADADQYREVTPLFVPFAPEDQKRREPKILGPSEVEAIFTVAMVKSYMLDTESKPWKIMVLRGENIKANKNQNRFAGNVQNMMGGMGGKGMMGGLGGPMGGMGGMGGMQGRQGGVPGLGGMMGGQMQGGMPGRGGARVAGLGGVGQGLDRNALGTRDSKEKDQKKDNAWVSIDEASNLNDVRLADRVLPLRMVIVEGSFPLKRQLEEYKSALHLPNEQAAFQELHFAGFVVERREVGPDGQPALGPDGKPSNWAEFGFEEAFLRVITASGKRWDKSQDESLALVRFDGLCMRLPEQFDRSYPGAFDTDPDKNKLRQLKAAIDGIKNKEQVAETLATKDSRFTTSTRDIYGTQDTPANQQQPTIGAVRQGGTGGGAPPGIKPTTGGASGKLPGAQNAPDAVRPGGVAGGAFKPVGGAGSGGNVESMMAGQIAGGTHTGELPEYALLRFIDVTVEPGRTYEYRYKIRVENPNFERVNEVAYKDLAKEKFLSSQQWFEVGKRITIPNDFRYFAVDMREVEKKTWGGYPAPQKDQVAMLLQRWVDQFNPSEGRGGKDYPVGDWAVQQVNVNRGEYVGGKHMVQMAIWDFYEEEFVFATKANSRNQKMVMMPFTESDTECPILVAFEGGTASYTKPEERRPVQDEGIPREVLLLSPEGKLVVHNSVDDHNSKDREEHVKAWWGRIEDVNTKKKEKKDAEKGTGPNQPGIFGPAGKGGGGKQ
jgi:hypothetical protein